MALPSPKPAGSDFPPKNDHHQRGTPQEAEPAATFMFVAYAAAKRGPPVGRIRTAAEALPAPIQQPCGERRLAFVSPDASRTDHCRGRHGLSRCTYGLRQTRRLSPRGRRTPFAHDRCAGPVGRGCGHSPRRRQTSCPIRVLFAPAQGGPLRPSALGLHPSLTPPKPPAIHFASALNTNEIP